MHVLMRSIFNLRSLRDKGRQHVAVIIDKSTGVDATEYVRIMRPWQRWLSIEAVVIVPNPLDTASLESWLPAGCQAVVIVSEHKSLVRAVKHACERYGLTFIDSNYPAGPSRTTALLQEVAHHDFEIGGVNEWDGQPTKYSWCVLQQLSYTHCEKVFPRYVLPYIEKFQQRRGGGPIETLEIGCGPISVLRWGMLQGLLTITGVDPLLDMYQIVLERHGLSILPNVSCQRQLGIAAEDLGQYVLPGSYDFAFSRNAVDHAEDPHLLLAQVGACLRPGGVMVLEFSTREGTKENWTQLHQFDLYVNAQGTLVSETRDGVCRSLVSEESGLHLREVVRSDKSYTIAVLEQQRGADPMEQEFGRADKQREGRVRPDLYGRRSLSSRVYTSLKRRVKAFAFERTGG